MVLKSACRRDRIELLDAMLQACGASERDMIAGELVEIAAQSRKKPRELAFRALARRFAQIGETDRDVVVRLWQSEANRTWASLIGDVGATMTEADGASVAMLAGWVGEPDLLAHLVRLASHPDERVAGAVEQSLEKLVGKVSGMQPAAAVAIAHALSTAVSAYGEHRRRGVLRAAATMWGSAAGLYQLEHLEKNGGAASWWADPTHEAKMGLRSLIRRDMEPAMARAALTWLRVEGLASACRDRLLEAGSSAEHEQVLGAAHLLAHPARRAALSGMGIAPAKRRELRAGPGLNTVRVDGGRGEGGLRWVVSPEALSRIDATARRFAPLWTAMLPMGMEQRRASLGAFIGDRSQPVRHAAVRAATGLLDTGTISDFCYDDGACVAVSAATARLCLRPPAGAGLVSEAMQDEVGAWGRLARSSHQGVRRIAAAALERYAGTKPGSANHALILRRRARRGREDVLVELRTLIDGSNEWASVSAIRTAVRMGLVDEMRVELTRALWREPTPLNGRAGGVEDSAGINRVAATAASALGDADDPATGEALRSCLAHEDVRVRSNALEALGKRMRRGGGVMPSGTRGGSVGIGPTGSGLRVMLEFKDDEHHRLRATSGWVIFMHGILRGDGSAGAWREEAEALVQVMLRDDRAGHLLAGLWLAERLIAHADDESKRRVGISAADLIAHPDARIGERAVRCVERSGVWEDGALAYEGAWNDSSDSMTEAA